MHETTPKVHLITHPYVRYGNMETYLASISGGTWIDNLGDETDPSEDLSEFAGRLCYRSWAPGLNANVKKIRKDHKEYFANILRTGHGSVLEHANFTFLFQDVSRVFTHELVRHRAGSAYSQESLRYVRLDDLGFRMPPLPDLPEEDSSMMHADMAELVDRMEAFQKKWGAILEAANLPFDAKKRITSAMRRVAPLGLSTAILWTANVRTIRFVLKQRTEKVAEEEIRLVFDQVGEIMMREAPLLFQDFERNEEGEWIPEYHKV